MIVRVARVPRPNVLEEVEVSDGATVARVLERIGAPLDAVIVLREGRPVPTDAQVGPQDELKIVTVFSGG